MTKHCSKPKHLFTVRYWYSLNECSILFETEEEVGLGFDLARTQLRETSQVEFKTEDLETICARQIAKYFPDTEEYMSEILDIKVNRKSIKATSEPWKVSVIDDDVLDVFCAKKRLE